MGLVDRAGPFSPAHGWRVAEVGEALTRHKIGDMAQVTTDRETPTRVVALSDRARKMVLDARSGEDGAEKLALWIEIAGTGPRGFNYDIYFAEATDAQPGDSVVEDDGVTVVVPAAGIASLQGATLDVSDEAGDTGLVMVNPNRPAGPPLPPGLDLDNPGLDTEVAQQISAVLDDFVNPSIASHGGRADLVAVAPAAAAGIEEGDAEGDADADGVVAYLRLSGGCQGCAMSRMTLSQGIESALRDQVPSVVGVVDVTDHASGANPYF